jgi:hypothetical protein
MNTAYNSYVYIITRRIEELTSLRDRLLALYSDLEKAGVRTGEPPALPPHPGPLPIASRTRQRGEGVTLTAETRRRGAGKPLTPALSGRTHGADARAAEEAVRTLKEPFGGADLSVAAKVSYKNAQNPAVDVSRAGEALLKQIHAEEEAKRLE